MVSLLYNSPCIRLQCIPVSLLRAEGGEYQELLDRIRSLPPTAEIKVCQFVVFMPITQLTRVLRRKRAR